VVQKKKKTSESVGKPPESELPPDLEATGSVSENKRGEKIVEAEVGGEGVAEVVAEKKDDEEKDEDENDEDERAAA
jgi:hypothetical protein